MKIKLLAIAAVLAAIPCAAGAQAVLNERTLSLSAAGEMAGAALERCRADGYKVTITVLNRATRTILVMSDDGANPHTVENSLRKAYTALTTRAPSANLGKRVAADPTLLGFLNLDKVTTLEGALPVFAAKELVGSIGISGAPGGEKDAACAQTGIDRIAKGLGN